MRLLYCCFFLFLYSFLAFAEAPTTIPENLVNEFTRDGKIPVLYWYFNESYPADRPIFWSKQAIDENIEKVKRKESNYYGITDIWLYQALEKYSIQNKTVLIIGSITPWYESIVLAYGGYPTTVDYNAITSDDPRICAMTVDQFNKRLINKNLKKFDIILSISSVEHDGLGRYGDPINPNGDLEFMKKAKKFLKSNGRMILAVPVGQDALVWNAHRIYGPIRLPLLFKEWECLDSFGYPDANLSSLPVGHWSYQPVFYLAPKPKSKK